MIEHNTLRRVALSLTLLLSLGIHAQELGEAAAAWRASSRIGYGPTPDVIAQIARAGGAQNWALLQVDAAFAASQMPAAVPASLPHANLSLPELFNGANEERQARRTVPDATPPNAGTQLQGGGDSAPKKPSFIRDVARESAAWRLVACSSPGIENPLLARMTEFWFNHLNVFAGKGAVRPFVGDYELQAIRTHALGRFEDLLLASAHHPAMLFYLDQAQSVADGTPGAQGNGRRGLNENYARELMELHTLGVDGGYSQGDVRELARILTGWTVGPRQPSGFRFAERAHDRGDKVLLGHLFRNRGESEGVEAIRLLARQPATARRIATRLAQFFVSDQPSPALIDRLARSFSASQGDIRVTLRTLFQTPEFWRSDQTLFKTPVDFACSALAALGGAQDASDTKRTLGFLANAGQPIHGWQTPDGYKTDAATWLSPEALTRRADFAVLLGRNAPAPAFLRSYLGEQTLARIDREPAALQTGLMLASPDFMRK